jgi:membrane fusion protein (multidrug efflux system)
MPVEVAAVRQETVRDQFRALGTIDAREIVQVVNELNAVVRELPFQEGRTVRRGQLLARLDDSEIGAEYRRAEALREQARVNHERIKTLYDQRAAAPQELDDASAAMKVAEANHGVAKARFDKTRILAPLDGVVGRRLVSPGAFLRTGDAITEVAAIDRVKIAFSVPERYQSLLRRGAPVGVTTPAWPGVQFNGYVSVVDPILDPDTRTVQLVAEIPNPELRLRPGMSANITATLSERPHSLTVPDEAVFAEGDQSFVYVVKADSSVTRQAIVLGTRDSSRVEVLQGLKDGDQVVRAGYQKLFEGARVMPVPSGGAPGGPGAAQASPAGAGAPAKAAGARAARGRR